MPDLTFALDAGADVRRRQIAQLVDACSDAAVAIAEILSDDHDHGLLLLSVVEAKAALVKALDRSGCAEGAALRSGVHRAVILLQRWLDRGDAHDLTATAELLQRADQIARLEGWRRHA